MSLKKKDVYSKLSDYSRKILGKSRSERAILSDKAHCEGAKSFNEVECGLAVKDCHTVLSDENIILHTPTPPNSPIYKHIEDTKINIIPIIKTIEEPYSSNEIASKNIERPKSERTSFNLCKIM
jgi:hypothetical protein